MNIFHINGSHEKNEELKKVSAQVDSAINAIVHDVFSCYNLELLSAPSVFIIEAVWGVGRDRELTPIQKAIHAKIYMVIHSVFSLLTSDTMSDAQKVTIHYVVMSLIATKIMHMCELLRNRLNRGNDDEKQMLNILREINVIGHA